MGRPKKTQVASATKTHPILGSKYVLPDTDPLWLSIMRRLQKTSRVYGFSRVELPVAEDVKVYERIGDGLPFAGTPLIADTGEERVVSLRAGLLPSALYAYASHKLYEEPRLYKWMFVGNSMAMEQGSLSSRFEYGFEVFGGFNHLTEAQVLGAAWSLVTSLGLEGLSLEINTIGTQDSQDSYQPVLTDYLKQKKFSLCDNCNELLSIRPLSVLRCEVPECQEIIAEAPTILDFLDQPSHKHFTNILEALDELQIPYQLNPLYVGIDGSSKTNVVIKCKLKDRTIVLGEAAYHDGLLKQFTNKPVNSFGFVGNLTALYDAMSASEILVVQEFTTEVFLVPLGELAAKKSLRLFQDLLAAHISVYDHFGDVGVKNQLKQAEVYKSPIALIMGQKEALDEMVILRDVKSGMQELFSYDKIVSEVKKRLGK